MSDLEKEVVSLVKFRGDYPVRQDYLAALLRATDKWLTKNDKSGDIFDNWDDGLATWYSDGIRAMHNKDVIPDFPDLELEEPVIEPVEDEDDTTEEAEQESTPVEGGTTVGSSEEIEEIPHSGDSEVPVPSKPKKAKKVKVSRIPTQYDEMTGEKDKFGITIGTKSHQAVLLYEQGTTAKEILTKVGGRHYNILTKLEKDGHKVDKRPGGGFKLTHKDEVPQ